MKTHDYSAPNRCWGHDYYIFEVYANGHVLDTGGWGRGIEPGDFIILDDHASQGTTRYRVKTISYEFNPPDMWSATLEFAPRRRRQTEIA